MGFLVEPRAGVKWHGRLNGRLVEVRAGNATVSAADQFDFCEAGGTDAITVGVRVFDSADEVAKILAGRDDVEKVWPGAVAVGPEQVARVVCVGVPTGACGLGWGMIVLGGLVVQPCSDIGGVSDAVEETVRGCSRDVVGQVVLWMVNIGKLLHLLLDGLLPLCDCYLGRLATRNRSKRDGVESDLGKPHLLVDFSKGSDSKWSHPAVG